MKRICAVVVNDLNQILVYTAQGSMSQCEEEAAKRWPHWDRLKELGCRVVPAEITIIEE
jgi:hypothetical protein